jgi:hypothetical protein
MNEATISEIEEQLKRLPPDKLAAVLDFVEYLAEKQEPSGSYQTMLASEQVLAKDWNTQEEDEAWAHL